MVCTKLPVPVVPAGCGGLPEVPVPVPVVTESYDSGRNSIGFAPEQFFFHLQRKN